MEYRRIEGIDKALSRVVFGCAIPAMLRGEDVNALLDDMYELGINVFDTAENYGLSEVCLGRWMKERRNRDKLVLISKGCHPYERDRVTPEDLRHDIEQSFERLGTDYIDIYFMHRDDLKVDVGPMVEILNEYKKAGKIGVFGGSNWTHERIQEANDYAARHSLTPFQASSPNFGLCDQIGDPFGGGAGCVTISGRAGEEARMWYRKTKMPVFAYSSLGRGFFSGRVKSAHPGKAAGVLDEFAVKGYCYPENFERLRRVEQLAQEKNCTVPQLALAWVLAQPLNVFPLVSASAKERMMQNLAALEIRLTAEEASWLNLNYS